MAGNEQPPVIDSFQSEEEVKLNFKSLFTFFSSLDYLRFLELEGAFENVKSRDLYYVGERASVIAFVIKKAVPSMTFLYWLFLIVLSLFYGFNPVVVSLVLIGFYVFLGFLLVQRYTLGQGYLYVVFKDFLLHTLVFTFVMWILGDLLIFYLLPGLWRAFLDWYLNVEGRFSYMIAEIAYRFLNPVLNRLIEVLSPYVYLYLMTSPVKAMSLAGVYIYFHYLSKKRKSRFIYKLERFKKHA